MGTFATFIIIPYSNCPISDWSVLFIIIFSLHFPAFIPSILVFFIPQKPAKAVTAPANMHPKCDAGSTFDLNRPGGFTEWPENLPGLICKTEPLARVPSRLSQCCSGPVYNITSPTSPDDPAYPVTCATLCQVDPEFDAFQEPSEENPYGFSDFFKCLNDDPEVPDVIAGGGNVNVVCATVSVSGKPMPTFTDTPTGDWTTKTFSDAGGIAWTDRQGILSDLSSFSSGESSMFATEQSSPTMQTASQPTTSIIINSSTATHETESLSKHAPSPSGVQSASATPTQSPQSSANNVHIPLVRSLLAASFLALHYSLF